MSTEIDTRQSPMRQPPSVNSSLFVVGVQKTGPHQPLIPMSLTTNGTITYASEADAKSQGLIAKAQVIAIPVLRSYLGNAGKIKVDDWFDVEIERFLNDDYILGQEWVEGKENIHLLLEPWFVQESRKFEVNVDAEDHPYANVKKDYSGKGFFIFESPSRTMAMTTEFNVKEKMMLLKSWVNRVITRSKPPVTKWAVVGRASVNLNKKDWTLQAARFPNYNWRYLRKFAGEIWIPTYTNKLRDQAWYYFHLRLLAHQIRYMMEKYGGGIKGYLTEDYMALAAQLVLQKAGLGQNKMPDTFDNLDLLNKITDDMFDDSNKAWKWRLYSQEQLKDYMIYHLIKAYVCSAIKIETIEVHYRLLSGDKKMAIGMLSLVDHADYDAFGNMKTPFYPQARTIPKRDIFLPCCLRIEGGEEQDIARVTPIQGDTFTTVSITGGVAKSALFSPMDKTNALIRWDLSSNDVTKEEITFKRETAYIWNFRFFGVTMKGKKPKFRSAQWLLTQFTGAASIGQRAFLMDVNLDLVTMPSLIVELEKIPVFHGSIIEPKKVEVPTESEIADIRAKSQTEITVPPSDTVEVTASPTTKPNPPSEGEVS